MGIGQNGKESVGNPKAESFMLYSKTCLHAPSPDGGRGLYRRMV